MWQEARLGTIICECAVDLYFCDGGSRTEYRSADDSRLMASTLAFASQGSDGRADTCTWHGHGIAAGAGSVFIWQSSGPHNSKAPDFSRHALEL